MQSVNRGEKMQTVNQGENETCVADSVQSVCEGTKVVGTNFVSRNIVRIINSSREEVSKGAKLYKCSACEFSSDYPSTLYYHMKARHKGFTIKRKIERRAPAGKGRKKLVTVVYTPAERLRKGEKMYMCSACGLTRDDTDSLYRHMEKFHKGLDMKRKRDIAGSLLQQMELIHGKVSTAGRVRNENKRLGKAVTVISTPVDQLSKGEEQYKCSACDLRSDDPHILYRHMKIEHRNFIIEWKGNENQHQQESGAGIEKQSQHYRVSLDVDNEDDDNDAENDYEEQEDSGRMTSVHGNHCEKNIEECNSLMNDPRIRNEHYHAYSQHSTNPPNGKRDRTMNNYSHNELNESDYNCSQLRVLVETASSVDRAIESGHQGLKNAGRKSSGKEISSEGSTHATHFQGRVVKILQNYSGNRVHGEPAFKCSECGKTSQTPDTLYKHMKTHHKGFVIEKMSSDFKKYLRVAHPDPFIPGRMEPAKGYPNQHTQNLEVEGSGSAKTLRAVGVKTRLGIRYKCSECRYIGLARKEVYRHARKVHKNIAITYHKRAEKIVQVREIVDESGHYYECSGCNIMCAHQDSCIQHMRSQHKGCTLRDINGKKVKETQLNSDDEELQRERATIESGEFVEAIKIPVDEEGNCYKCSMCNERSKSVNSLYSHMRWQHTEYPILKRGGIGGIRMEYSRDGRQEIPLNGSEKIVEIVKNPGVRKQSARYKCSACVYRSNFLTNTYKHMRRCHKDFTILKNSDPVQDGGKTVQVIDVTGKKTDRYKCSACNKTSDDPRTLYGHMRLQHKGYRIFKMTDHMRRPIEENRYKCSECNFFSNFTSSLYTHMASAHVGFTIVKKTSRPQLSDHVLNLDSENCSESADGSSLPLESGSSEKKTVCIVDNPEKGGYPYKCSLCDQSSHYTKSLYSHMERAHKGCDIIRRVVRNANCDGKEGAKIVYIVDVPRIGTEPIFESVSEDTAHVIRVPTKIYFQYKCSACDRVSYNMDILYRHMERRHTDMRIKRDVLFNQTSGNEKDRDGTTALQNDNVDVLSNAVDVDPMHPVEELRTVDVVNRMEISVEYDTTKMDKSNIEDNRRSTSVAAENGNSDSGSNEKSVQIIPVRKVKNSHFKCSACSFTGHSSGEICQHMRCKHTNLKIVKEADVKLMKRMFNYYNGNTQGNSCEEQTPKLVQIVKNLTREPHRYKCSQCGTTSSTTGNLYKHMKLKHTDFRIIMRCDMDKNFVSTGVHPNESCETGERKEESSKNEIGNSIEQERFAKTVFVMDIPFEELHRFKCSECAVTSNHCDFLYNHMARHHTDLQVFKPTESRMEMATSSERVEESDDQASIADEEEDDDSDEEREERRVVQIIKLWKDGKDVYKCSECDRTSYNISILYKHMKLRHKGDRIVKENDVNELENLSSASGIVAETSRDYTDSSDLDLCDDSENEDFTPTVHVIDIPKVGNNKHIYKCSKCEKTCAARNNLYKHMRRKHKESIIIMKTDLLKKKALSNDQNIEGTVRILDLPIVGKCRYKCSVCGTTSHSRDNLYRHMKLKHKGLVILKINERDVKGTVHAVDCPEVGSPRYKCSMCDTTSDNLSNLYRHMRCNHKDYRIVSQVEKISKNVPDDEGNKEAVIIDDEDETSTTIKQENSEEDDYKGTVRVINRKGQVGSHRYKCSECNRTSTNTGNLYKHMRAMHQNLKIIKKVNLCRKIRSYSSSDENLQQGQISDNHEMTSEHDFEQSEDETIDVISDKGGGIRGEGMMDDTAATKDIIPYISTPEILDKADEGDVKGTVHAVPMPEVGSHKYKCSRCDTTTTGTANLYSHMRNNHKGYRIVTQMDKRKSKNVSDDEGNKEAVIIDNDEDQTPTTTKQTISEEDNYEGTVRVINRKGQVGSHRYKCSECDRTSNTTGNLYKHMKAMHRNLKLIRKVNLARKINALCRKYSSSESLQQGQISDNHDRIVKKTDLQKKKSSDEQECSDEGDVKGTVHAVPMPEVGSHKYKCSMCDTTTTGTANLYRHMRNNHKGYTIVTQMDKRKSKNVSDDEVTSTTMRQENSEEDSYEGTVRVINRKGQVGSHRYKCSECGRTSNTTGNLYKHMKAMHRNLKIIKKVNPVRKINALCGRYSSSDESLEQGQISDNHEMTSEHDFEDGVDETIDEISDKCDGIRGEGVMDVTALTKDIPSTPEILDKADVRDVENGCKGNKEPAVGVHNFLSKVSCFECSQCMATFPNLEELDSHVSHSHEQPAIAGNKTSRDNTDCSEQEYSDDGDAEGIVHIVDIREGSNRRYKCSMCDTASDSTTNLYRHMRSNHEGYTIVTQMDKRKSMDVSDDEGNKEAIVNNDENQTSMIPKQANSEEKNYKGTVWVINRTGQVGSRRYKCSKCHKTSMNTGNLYKHMRAMHRKLKIVKKISPPKKTNASFETGASSGSFQEQRSDKQGTVWVIKRIAQAGSHRYQCSECDKTSNTTGNLYRHMRSRHRKLRIIMVLHGIDIDDLNQKCSSREILQGQRSDTHVHVVTNEHDFEDSADEALDVDFKLKDDSTPIVREGIADEMATPKGIISTPEILDKADVSDVENGGKGNKEPALEVQNFLSKVSCFECSQCMALFSSLEELDSHVESHSHEPRPAYARNETSRDITDCSDLDLCEDSEDEDLWPTVHVLDVPKEGNNRRMYKCSKCETYSPGTSNLYKHMRMIHKRCRIIRKIDLVEKKDTSSTSSIKNIEGTVRILDLSKGENPWYKCSVCYVSSDSRDYLYQHMKFEHKDLAIVNQIDDVKNKKAVDNDNEDQTSTTTKQANSEEDHYEGTVMVIKRSGQVGSRRYKCSACDKTSKYSSNLYKHMGALHPKLRIIRKLHYRKRRKALRQAFTCTSREFLQEQGNEKHVATSERDVEDATDETVCETASQSRDYSHQNMESVPKDSAIVNKVINIENEADLCSGGDQQECLDQEDIKRTVHIVGIPKVGNHKFKCSMCEKTSEGTSNLYSHMRNNHKGYTIVTQMEKMTRKHDVSDEINKKAATTTLSNSEYPGIPTVQVLDISKVGKHRYQCSRCNATSVTTGNLYKHMRCVHKGFRIVKKTDVWRSESTSICSGKEEDNEHDVNESLNTDLVKVTSGGGEDNLGLGGCNNKEENNEGTVRLINRKGQVGSHRYKCSKCDKTGNGVGNMYSHMKLRHPKLKIIKRIQLCKKRSDNIDESAINPGIRTVQVLDITKVGKHRYQCSRCNATSVTTGNLYKHMRRVHKGFRIVKKTDVWKNESTSICSGKEEDNEHDMNESLNTDLVKVTSGGGEDNLGLGGCNNNNDDVCESSVGSSSTVAVHFTPKPRTDQRMLVPTKNDDNDKISEAGKEHHNQSGSESESPDNPGPSSPTVQVLDISKVGKHRYQCSRCNATSVTTGNLYKHMRCVHKGFRIVKKTDRVVKGNKTSGDFDEISLDMFVSTEDKAE